MRTKRTRGWREKLRKLGGEWEEKRRMGKRLAIKGDDKKRRGKRDGSARGKLNFSDSF